MSSITARKHEAAHYSAGAIRSIDIPDSKLCRRITELVRDTESELLFRPEPIVMVLRTGPAGLIGTAGPVASLLHAARAIRASAARGRRASLIWNP